MFWRATLYLSDEYSTTATMEYNRFMPSLRESRAFKFWQKYEHHLGVGALLVGFAFDVFLAKSPASVVDNILLVCYLFIAATIIILLNIAPVRRRREAGLSEPFIFLLVLQFCFGGLASNMLVLYGKSGTLSADAFFVGLLLLLVFGNEYLRSRYAQLRFNVAVYYFLLLTYCTIAAPTWIFHSIGTGSFLLSGLISLAVMAVFLTILFVVVLRGAERQKQLHQIGVMVAVMFMIFNGLYFLNIIPPVPLSLKDIGVYHSVLKYSSGNYLAMYEPAPWYEFWQDTSPTFTYEAGESAYCFSSVYAPAKLDTPIYHVWEYYDPSVKSWEVVGRISFDIAGGRADGYRGFSVVTISAAGQWRCNVETASGALIGRTSFTAVQGTAPVLDSTTL